MEATTLEQLDMSNKIIAVNAHNLRVSFNIRYGWENDNIIGAYKTGIDELENSIRVWGFKPNEPLEVYESEEGFYNILEGHRRFAAVQKILLDDPDYNFGNGLANGEIWVFVSPKPENTLKLLASQFDANKSQGNTPLDIAKAISFAINSKEMKGTKVSTYATIGEEIAGWKSWQAVDTAYKVYQLPPDVKDWIQESEIDKDLPISLSFSTAGEVANYYGVDDATKLLEKALEIYQTNPESIKTFGNKVNKQWLHDLGVELKLKKKPPSSAKTQPAITRSPISHSDSKESIFDADENQTIERYSPNGSSNSSGVDNGNTGDFAPIEQIKTSLAKKLQTPPQPVDRVKTLVIKNLTECAGVYFIEGRTDIDAGKFIVEFPMDIGEHLASLVSVLVDPVSNSTNGIEGLESNQDLEF